MKTLYFAIISIALSVAAQFALKAGMSGQAVKDALMQPVNWRTPFAVIFDKFVFSGFALYGLGAVVWLAVLSKWDVSKAYPLVGLGFGITAAIGFLAGENVNASRLFGTLCICAGVFLVSRS